MRFDSLCGVFVFFDSSSSTAARNTFTLVEACPDGWWYSAVLPNNEFVAVFMTDGDLVSRFRLRELSHWMSLMEQAPHTARRLSGARPVTPPRVAAASSRILDCLCGPGWLAVGDAGSTIDPLSSHGILKALGDGIEAAGAVQRYLNGSEGALAEFAGRVAAGFETYLETREAYYRIESRWPNHDFWRRRQPQIQLHPLRMLRTGNTAAIRQHAAGMPEDDLHLLSRLCATPLQAHGLVSAFRANSRHCYPDRRIILTVQALVESGILQVCEDEESPAEVPD